MKNIEKYMEKYFRLNEKPTLDSMRYLMDFYNDFDKEMKIIHIAGTNGKGSTTRMLSNVLITQGYNVGEFISPSLIKINERMSICGKNIEDEELSYLIEKIEPVIENYNKTAKTKVTAFELETMLALLYFYKNKVDFVVLETGLGGIFDSTNVITKPLLSIITSIGYDHMRVLGNTLPEIAYQKAGIIKQNSKTVFLEQQEDVNKVIIDTCKNRNNELHLIKESEIKQRTFDNEYQYFSYKKLDDIKINLKGKAQYKNATLVLEAINILKDLGYEISENSIREGLSTVVHRARMETICQNPLIIYDGAHNEPAIENFNETINMYYSDKKYKKTYIISILKSKDYKKVLDLLLEDPNNNTNTQTTFILTPGNSEERFVSSEELYIYASMKKKDNQKLIAMKLEEAIEQCYKTKNDIKQKDEDIEDVNFIIGSLYTYSTAIRKINEIKNKENYQL